jgi:hypothetical protein
MYFSPGWPLKLFNKTEVSDYLPEYKQLNFEILNKSQQFLLILLIVFIAFQVFFPLRHILYPGNASWTEEGHDFAWHMMLKSKQGSLIFKISAPGNKLEPLTPKVYLTKRQKTMIATRPYFALQMAHYIKERYKIMGIENVEVRVEAKVSLNGRRKQLIIDPNIDLTMYNDSLMPAEWILPLTKPLRPTE